MMKLQGNTSNPSISDVYTRIKNDSLEVQPDFQRRFVWTAVHQAHLIDTIRKGYPFPEIYVAEGAIDLNKKKTTKYVIDGQQRLTTIVNYIDGYEALPNTVSFDDLSEEEKQSFLRYPIVERDLGNVSDEDKREIFRRINLTQFSLKQVEIQNAIYDGPFIKVAKDLAEANLLDHFEVFREAEYSRMADVNFFLLVMATIQGGVYFAQDKDVEDIVKTFNEVYPMENQMASALKRTLRVIACCRLAPDSMWFRKSNFFTLLVEIGSVCFHKHKINLDLLRVNLVSFEHNVLTRKAEKGSIYEEYYSCMFTGTSGKRQRVTRAKHFSREVLGIV